MSNLLKGWTLLFIVCSFVTCIKIILTLSCKKTLNHYMARSVAITTKEYVHIHKTFDALVDKMEGKLVGDDQENLNKAFEMARDAHGSQRRRSGEPYILHPIEVARICMEEIGLGPTAVVAALLHDVVEDTVISQDHILKIFGPKISKIVDGLTKIDGLYNVGSPQAQNLKKVLSTLVEDVRVILIKMADRLHNLRTIDSMPKHKQLRIAAETAYIYAPLAHRLGLYNVKTEYEDIILKINEPESYNYITSKIKDTDDARQKYIKDFFTPLNKKLELLEKETNYRYTLTHEGRDVPTFEYRTQGRVKAISSINNKLKNKNIPFEKIYDLFAIRIIADVPVEDEKRICWQIYSVVTDVYKPIPERLKDWVTSPKSNGYESLHTTVIGPDGKYVEIQIRSERMNEISERGFAAHWKYKGIKDENSVYDRWLNNIREILDEQHADAIEFINDFKTNLFAEEVYVFTPKGDMRVLPKGATALDFAFEIHSDIGYKTTALKVNDRIVPMGFELSNGDRVEVITNNNQKPSEAWLKMVVTGKARSKIRSSMKEELRKQGELGKEALMRKLKRVKADFELNADDLVKYYGFNSRPDLYYAIAQDNIKINLKDFDVDGKKLIIPKKESNQKGKHVSDVVSPKTKGNAAANILIDGEPIDMYEYEIASCCNPVQGDSIFGFLTTGNGLKIHRISCRNASNLLGKYGYRVLNAQWSTISRNDFVVDIKVTGIDSGIGVIQNLINEISNKLKVNIRSFNISGNEGYFESNMSVIVKNKDQLTVVMNSVKGLEGVADVQRVEK